ncbi:DUF669 domain-containing protein [Tepidibacter hydrothermalis]|uniref:DUF669 domain-containing protein n=1 Tax=Tepidibacter hydrothermalis TaxID=3036126 RepID=A0ABY8EH30_9FIRM|nr:DUF669 domain-containing protein [Tepidibacter hydrothermalis]WFD12236.1 DUF669 domain-containing protein [Tepidibacter hydrothermalis]
MANIWDKFDDAIDTKGLQEDVREAAKKGTGSFRDVPHGQYEVRVDKMELGESKKGDPMVTIFFKVLEGEYKGENIPFWQVINQGFQIHIVNELLKSMESDVVNETAENFNQIDIKKGKEPRDRLFDSYNQYGNFLMDVMEEIDGKLEFNLKYGKGKKDFSTYEITEVFEVE